MTDTSDLTRAWNEVQSRLPQGWKIDGLRCASVGLAPEQRSDVFVAVAVGPDGAERISRAVEPAAALRGLISAIE